MTKKLLPTMIGAALVAGMSAASADVTVFGHLDTAIASQDTDIGFVDLTKMPGKWSAATANSDDINLVCTTCSIGFKGSEDLGNGLKAIFKLDFQFDTVNRAKDGAITDRDQWVGMAGGFGKVRIGTISTGYKSHGAMIDPLYRTVAQGRAHGLQSFLHSNAGEEGEGRATNTIRWDSADFNGVELVAHYTLDSNEANEDENPFGIGASYKNGGILVFADYLTNEQSGASELTAWKIGGKFSMNAFAVMAQYEDIENNNADGEMWHIGGSYTMGNNMLYAAYGEGEADAGFGAGGIVGDSESESFTIAGTHSLSKRTKAYVAYNQKEESDTAGSADADVFAVGLKHKF